MSDKKEAPEGKSVFFVHIQRPQVADDLAAFPADSLDTLQKELEESGAYPFGFSLVHGEEVALDDIEETINDYIEEKTNNAEEVVVH